VGPNHLTTLTVTPFQQSLICGGHAYQELVEQLATPVVIEPGALGRLLGTDITILGTPAFEGRKLKLRGRPDGIDAAGGALYPIEIKSHRAPTHLDRLELAFYWLLLRPHRTRPTDPSGVLILRHDGSVACQRDGLWCEFCDQVTVGDCWHGSVANRAGVVAGWRRRRVLKITIWGAGGVLPPVCNEAPVGRG
jgi:hypothetical protein